MGQILSLPMVIAGIGLIILGAKIQAKQVNKKKGA